MKIKKGFYNKIRRLVKLLSEPGIEIKMDCCERENSKEIIEQLKRTTHRIPDLLERLAKETQTKKESDLKELNDCWLKLGLLYIKIENAEVKPEKEFLRRCILEKLKETLDYINLAQLRLQLKEIDVPPLDTNHVKFIYGNKFMRFDGRSLVTVCA